MVKESKYKMAKFATKEIAQKFIDKFTNEEQELFTPIRFSEDDMAEYWGVGITSLNKKDELDNYATFIDNCTRLALRPRFAFLNRIDSKKIMNGKKEEVGLPWLDDDDYEVPVGAEEPIEGSDVSEEENMEEMTEMYAQDFNYLTGTPSSSNISEEYDEIDSLMEAVVPVNVNKRGMPDGRRKSTRDMKRSLATLDNVEVIPMNGTEDDVNMFKTALNAYAESPESPEGLIETITYKFGSKDLVIRKEYIDAKIMDLINQYISKQEMGQEMQEEPLEDIDSVTDIPEMEF